MFENARRGGSLAPLVFVVVFHLVPLALWVLPVRVPAPSPDAIASLVCARARP